MIEKMWFACKQNSGLNVEDLIQITSTIATVTESVKTEALPGQGSLGEI